MNRIISTLLLFGTVILSLNSQAQLIGGNGGTGFLTKSKQVYLYDLREYDMENQMFIGGLVDREILNHKSLLNSLAATIPYPQDVLLRKLSDLQKLSPHLGLYVMQVLSLYSWELSPNALPVIDEGEVDLPPGAHRVQLAIRYEKKITVSEIYWKQLSPEHQVGLLIHEALFALIRPVCSDVFPYECRQPVETVWKLVADFFSSTFLLKKLTPEEKQVLSLPDYEPSLDVNKLHIKVVSLDPQNQVLLHLKYEGMNYTEKIDKAVNEICIKLGKVEQKAYIVTSAVRFPYVLTYRTYCANFGAQLKVEFVRRPAMIKGSFNYHGLKACVYELNRYFTEIFYPPINNSVEAPVNCEATDEVFF